MEQINMFEMMYKSYKLDRNKEIVVLETFAGIGSQRKALDRLSAKHNLKMKYLAPVEFDKYPVTSYNAIFGTEHNTKDITQTHSSDYNEQIDIFTYSFPCQDISLAGNRNGLSKEDNTRSGLLWEVERILKEFKSDNNLPKVLLMENVKNLLGEQFRMDFQQWIRELEKLGYSNYFEVLNAKDYGIPQNRERVFMVSILGEYNYNFPQPIPLDLRLKDMLEDEVDEKYYINAKFNFVESENQIGNLSGGKWDKINESCRRVYNTEEISPTIHTMGGGNTEPKVLITNETICINSKVDGKQPSLQDRVYDTNGIATAVTCSFMPSILETPVIAASRGRNKDNPNDRIIGVDLEQRLEINSQGLCNTLTTVQKDNYVITKEKINNIKNKEVSNTIRSGGRGSLDRHEWDLVAVKSKDVGVVVGNTQKNAAINCEGVCPTLFHNYSNLRIRKLTPLECIRLMGFDDEDYYKMKSVNMSNTQIYKQCGNSIVVNVLEAIFEQLF